MFHFGSKFGGRAKAFRTFSVPFFRLFFWNGLLRVHGKDQTVHTFFRQKLIDPYIVFWVRSKNVWSFGKNFSATWSKLPSMCPKKLYGKGCLWQKSFSVSFLKFERKLFWCLSKFYFLKSVEFFRKESFFFCFWSLLPVFSDIEQKVAHFPDENFASLSNFHNTSQTVFLKKK